MGQRIKAAKDDAAQHDNDGEKPQQARHQVLALILLVPATGTEYDHVRPELATYSERNPDVPALSQTGVGPCSGINDI